MKRLALKHLANICVSLRPVSSNYPSGFTALFIGYFPFMIERLGLKRLSAWPRRWWDESAR